VVARPPITEPAERVTTLRQLVARYVARFLELPSFRKVFVGLSLVAVPLCFAFGFYEQALNPLLRAPAAICWFAAAGINAVLLFWAWEVLTEFSRRNRILALLLLCLVILLFVVRAMRVAAEAAEQAAESTENEIGRQISQKFTEDNLLAGLKSQKTPRPPTVAAATSKPVTPAAQPTVKAKAPSFAYIVPGVWLNKSTSDFIVRHYGPDPVNNIELVFNDVDRQTFGAQTNHSFSLNELGTTLHFPEIDPIEGFWAKQFLWTPLNPDNENYWVVQTSREGRFVEPLKIVGKDRANWQYAMKVTDELNHKTAIHCRDPKFPISEEFPENLPKYFPDLTVGKPKPKPHA